MRGSEYFVNPLHTIPITLNKQKTYRGDTKAVLKYKQ